MTAIALMIWLYIVSFIILIGAEFNAVRYPRYQFGTFSSLERDEAARERNPHEP